MSEVKTDKLSPRTDSGTTTLGDSGDTFLVNTGAKLDLNGTELILDANANTSITADTDDQIDIRIAGADDFQFTANTFTAQSGSTIAAQALTATTITTSSTIDINGNELILDADADTSITADTDDQIDIKIAGADDFRFTANNFNILSGSTLTVDSGATITNSGTATNFGGGKCLQIVHSDTTSATGAANNGVILTVTNDGSGQTALYGLRSNRVWGTVCTLNITAAHANNLLVCMAGVGFNINTYNNKGAMGLAVITNSSGADVGYDYGNFPSYPTNNGWEAGYRNDMFFIHTIAAGSTSQQTVSLQLYAYCESSPNQSQTLNCRGGDFTIMEIEV